MSFSFGSNTAPTDSSNVTPAAAAPKSFSFGSTPVQATTETKQPKVGFSFGSTPSAVAAPTDSVKTPSSTFAFGSTFALVLIMIIILPHRCLVEVQVQVAGVVRQQRQAGVEGKVEVMW